MHSARQLELVRMLAEHRHFGRAAAALGISQPALTRSLKAIEDTLGVALFDRDGVTPTLFGRIVLDRCDPILDGFRELMREVSLAKGLEIGELTVSLGQYPGEMSGQRAIGILSERHPGLVIHLRLTNWTGATQDVLSGRSDLGLADISEITEHPELDTEPLRSSQLFFFCSTHHPLAGRAEVESGELLDYPWVGPITSARISKALPHVDKPFGTFDKASGRFVPRILSEAFSATKAVVLSGSGLSVALPHQLDDEIAAGRCVLLPVLMPAMRIQYGFASRRGRIPSPAALAYMSIVRKLEREIGP